MLALIRILLISFFIFLTGTVGLIYCILRPFHPNSVHYFSRLYGSMSWILGVKVIRRYAKELETAGPCVYIGNHQNTYDIFTIAGSNPPRTVSMGKKSLKWIPFFGQLYLLSGNILIDRNNRSSAATTLEKAAKQIKERNLGVWIFPEGTRSRGKGLLKFKVGAFKLAMMANVPVATICCTNLHEKIKLNRWDNGTMLVEILPPIMLDESKTAKEWADFFRDHMQQNIDRLEEELRQIESGASKNESA